MGGGAGLINVPNGQRIFNQSLFHQLVFEHINYFTPYSLAYMANKAGFDVIEINNIEETIELDMYVRKARKQPEVSFVRETLRTKLREIAIRYNSITIWGGGAKSAKYAELIGQDVKIGNVLDSSQAKAGKYIIGINRKITPPTTKIVCDSDLIVIFASSYNSEIMNELRNIYNYRGDIAYFEEDDVVLDCL